MKRRLAPKDDAKRQPKLKGAVDRGFQQRYGGRGDTAKRKRTGDNDSGKAWLE